MLMAVRIFFDTLVARAIRKLAGFTACFFEPRRRISVGQFEERSAGQIRLLLDCFGGKCVLSIRIPQYLPLTFDRGVIREYNNRTGVLDKPIK